MGKFNQFLFGQPLLVGDNTIPGVSLYPELEVLLPKIFQAVRDFGCDYYPTVVQRVRYDEMSEIAAYDGFPVRYPHWQWGMEYEKLQTGFEHGMHRIYEMVINTNPCYIYLLESNTLVDDILVVAHALGHCDFFKNNIYFEKTSQNMMNEFANHGTRIRKYMRRYGKEKVTEFIDHVLRIETLIDPAQAWQQKKIKNPIIWDERKYKHPARLPVDEGHDYMERHINPPEWINKQQKKIDRAEVAQSLDIFQNPTKNIMRYLKDNAPLRPWQSDILAMLYEEAMYFAPNRMTKTLNEGWACLSGNSYVPTSCGILPIKEVVENRLKTNVNDGKTDQRVTNFFKFKKATKKIRTRRGYELTGSFNHRIWNANCDWVRLDEVKIGDEIKLSVGGDIWASDYVSVDWSMPKSKTVLDLCKEEGVHYQTLMGYKNETKKTKKVQQCEAVLNRSSESTIGTLPNSRKKINVPSFIDEKFGAFVGYMVGDGHISDKKRTLGLTTGDIEQSDYFMQLLEELFGLIGNERWDDSSKNGRWRISVTSKNLRDLLVHFGLKTGKAARIKEIPYCIMRSPKKVMSAFLRAYFDCDAYAGPEGIILSTSSQKLSAQVQIVLANYGILSSRNENKDETWHVRVTGKSAKIFRDEIGFGLTRKQERLDSYINDRNWFVKESFVDEVVFVEDCGVDEVFDITVKSTHRYAALGFINHNSRVDCEIMAAKGFAALGQDHESGGIIEYAEHKWGVLGGKYSMNPYKLGYCLFTDIEERWDKGRFGSEWENCEDLEKKKKWDTKAGLGREKIFEVRKYYNDLTAIMEFFTPEFAEKYKFFDYVKNPNGEYVVNSTGAAGYKKIKKKLVDQYLNGGLPDIRLVDPNHKGKGYMLLEHIYTGQPLYEPWVAPCLEAICFLWKNEVYLTSVDPKTEEEIIYCCKEPDANKVEIMTRSQYEQL